MVSLTCALWRGRFGMAPLLQFHFTDNGPGELPIGSSAQQKLNVQVEDSECLRISISLRA
jgi:hypothetical protein